jgi:hypothetical protein
MKKPTDEDIHTPTLDIADLLSDPAIEANYQKHYKGDRLRRDTTTDS